MNSIQLLSIAVENTIVADEMDDLNKGRRNITIVLVLLALFDIVAIVVLVFFPGTLTGNVATAESESGRAAAAESEQPEESEARDNGISSEPEGEEPGADERDEAATDRPDSESAEAADRAQEQPGEPREEGASDRAVPQDLSEVEPIPASSRDLVRQYEVERTDTFYTLTGRVWEDEHLWPDLYILNRPDFPDPDFIAEGSTIAIFEELGENGELSDRELATLLDAYIRTYAVYRELGEKSLERARQTDSSWHYQLGRVRINKAHWLLYSGLRFYRDLLEDYGDRIQDRDERVVRQFIARFGYPER